MERSPWVTLDMSYLAYRAVHTTGGLSWADNPTGVIFGILRDIRLLSERFNTERFVFAFDSRRNLRREKYPWYKNRPMDAEKLAIRKSVHQQLDRLQNELLPKLSVGSILCEDGYEADDLIASAVYGIKQKWPEYPMIYIVSGDQDMYQCLGPGVRIVKRAKAYVDTLYRRREFKTEHCNISPTRWAEVKAIAGCSTDTIPGVDGVGEFTAAKYLMHKLNTATDTFHRIRAFCRSPQYKINLELIQLPYKNCPPQIDKIIHLGWEDSRWRKCLKSLGIRSLTDQMDQRNARRGYNR